MPPRNRRRTAPIPDGGEFPGARTRGCSSPRRNEERTQGAGHGAGEGADWVAGCGGEAADTRAAIHGVLVLRRSAMGKLGGYTPEWLCAMDGAMNRTCSGEFDMRGSQGWGRRCCIGRGREAHSPMQHGMGPWYRLARMPSTSMDLPDALHFPSSLCPCPTAHLDMSPWL